LVSKGQAAGWSKIGGRNVRERQNMRTLGTTAQKAVVALVVVVGITATSLAGGASTSPSPRSAAPAARTIANTKITYYHFNASYTGTISILWNSSGASTASIRGKGKGTDFGFATITGSGSATAASQSVPVHGSGALSGVGESLIVKFVTGSTATAASGSAPTVVAISGTVVVVKGAGKFAGASGSLKVSGVFSIKSTSGSEKETFHATLKGVVKVTTK
jgi:hypothetical protein